MKKMMVMLLALAMSISCLVLPAGAVQVEGNPCDTHMAVQPREFLQLSKTQRVVNSKKLNLVADITVKYTVRGEAANSSGFYITGIKRKTCCFAKRERANTISCCGETGCFQTSYFTVGIGNCPAIYRQS